MTSAHLLQQQLLQLFWSLNFQYFGGVLPWIPVNFSNRLKSTGGTYAKKPHKAIQISSRYLQMPDAWKEITDTLGHEMIHYWLDFQGQPCGHTPAFHQKMRDCKFQRYSRLTPVRARYIYICSACYTTYYRRKKGVWSCGPCSGKRFNPRFQLELIEDLKGAKKNHGAN